MADKEPSKASAAEPPQPVHIGGESFVDRVRPHLKQIMIGTGVLVVVLLVIFGVRAYNERNQRKATDGLDHVLEIARQPIRGKDEKPDPKRPSFASEKERAVAVLALPGIETAGPAFRGGMLLDAGKPDEAAAEYRKGIAAKTIDGVLCREGLGIALEAKATAEKDPTVRQKGLEEALAAFAVMQPDEAGPRRAHALYHQGRIQLLLGKRSEARALFEAAKLANKDAADREIAEMVEKRLAALGAS
jgi:predicted negative regulator of RcsB-dependent stress response